MRLPLFLALEACSFLPALRAGCGTAEPIDRPEGFVDPDLRRTGAGPVSQLWREPVRLSLTPSTLPRGFDPGSAFPVRMRESVKERKNTTIWRAPSPFGPEHEGRVTAPDGMRLFAGGRELRFSGNLGGPSWVIRDGSLLVAWPGPLPEGGVTVEYEEARNILLRRDFGSAELEPAEFARYTLTLADRTRKGLLLPAPSSAEWDVVLPRGAVFDAWVALAPPPVRNLSSDGAFVHLEVVVDGASTAVDRQWVDDDDGRFAHFRADLSAWEGRSVTLRVRTDPYGTSDFDAVFVGGPAVWGAPDGEPRTVVVVGMDTTRPDHFGFYGYGRDTTDELDAVARTSTVFDNTWTPAPRTRPSFRSASTGRRPLDAVGAKNIAEVFQDLGFATGAVVSNVHLQPRFGFDRGFDDWWYLEYSKADGQVRRALQFLDDYRDRDTFLFLHVMDPHLLYNAPAWYRNTYVTDPDPELPNGFSRWDVQAWERNGELTERRKVQIEALYDAELKFTSDCLGTLFDELDRRSQRQVVVVHSDHGEEFWEHGAFEHNHSLYQELVHGLLWFRSGPGQRVGRRVAVPATLADIAPTLFDLVGVPDPPPTDGRNLAPVLFGAEQDPAGERPIGLGHLRYGTERWGVVLGGRKYVLHTGSGQEELFDLAADPEERSDIAGKHPLDVYRTALADAHGMPVGRGWRVRLDVHDAGGEPFVLTLPVPAIGAVVVDPETTLPNPKNDAWGEAPRRVPSEIGTVSLDPSSTELTWTPGTNPSDGLLFVLFGKDVSPDSATLARGGRSLPLNRLWRWAEGKSGIRIDPGTVFLPPPDESARMHGAGGRGASGADLAMLCRLGYKDGDECAGIDREH